MKKASGFKMNNPSIAKLAKAAGSPMKKEFDIKKVVPQPKKEKLSYDDAYLRRDLNLYGKLSKDEFIAEAKRQKSGGKVPTKPMETKVLTNKQKEAQKKTTPTDTKKNTDAKKAEPKAKTKVGKFLSRVVGTGAKRKANEANKKKRQNRSVTGRLKAKASKFGRMGT
jgi:hypothetical protein